MSRIALLLTSMLLTAALLAAGIGTVAADPLNNYRLKVPASCEVDDKPPRVEEFKFVINGEGVAGHIIGETGNIMPVKDEATYTYLDQIDENGNPSQVTVFDQLGKGKKNGLQRDLKTCGGTVTYDDPELGQVKVEFVIQAFFTPRGR